ncbi:MYB-like transcription factor ETC3 [Hirschfeldia incana]|nr:MYB-like transcription factor ETC3 [Hirschfeldia incana]
MDKHLRTKQTMTNPILTSLSEGKLMKTSFPTFPCIQTIKKKFMFEKYECFVMTYETEVSSLEWQAVNMNPEEEDLICRMHKLVGDRWELIAGRIPGRTAAEIERFWVMKYN